jgi:5-methylcytosine-specific restriction endonuclease McrA
VESKEERRKREARERVRRWRAQHPEYKERARERQKEWYEQNKSERQAKNRENQRARYALDPEPIRARNRAWYQNNKDQRHDYYLRRKAAEPEDQRRQRERERTKRRYLSDPAGWLASQKNWRERNPEKAHAYTRASHGKRRAATKGVSFTTAEWLALLERHGGRCAYCGSDFGIEIDHRIPLNRGGSNTIENILPACRRCNRRKNQKTEEEFRELLQRERRQGLELGREGLDGNAGTTRS